MKRMILFTVACVAVMLTVGQVQAALLGPVYPAPGGNTFSGNGVSGADGLAIWNLGGFDTNEFDSLYYGADNVNYGPNGAGLDGSANSFFFTGASGQTATWASNTLWRIHNSPGGSHSGASTRLTMTVEGLGANPWIDANSVGINIGTYGDVGVVVDNSAGVAFTVKWEIEANTGSGWQALNSVLQHSDHNGRTRSSFATGFYSTEPVVDTVPEPTSMAIFGIGALCMGAGAARRRRKEKLAAEA
ncbi:MAG: hypothetical protein COA78_10475 [Blastopirellula sp.]|nr:MAG: hypothetical protein COA78_10475 [Blastopirellula sp.]